MVYKCTTDITLWDLHERYGPLTTVYNRLWRCARNGTLTTLIGKVRVIAETIEELDQEVSVDSSTSRAQLMSDDSDQQADTAGLSGVPYADDPSVINTPARIVAARYHNNCPALEAGRADQVNANGAATRSSYPPLTRTTGDDEHEGLDVHRQAAVERRNTQKLTPPLPCSPTATPRPQ